MSRELDCALPYRYLDFARAGLMGEETVSAITQHLHSEAQWGHRQASASVKARMRSLYGLIGELLRVEPEEVALFESASMAWNAILGSLGVSRGDAVVTLASEFGTNLLALRLLTNSSGARLCVADCGTDGSVDLDQLASLIQEQRPRLVALSHVAAQGSILNPVEEIGHLCRENGALYVIDGAQAVGQIPVDLSRIECDAYTATGRKWLNGPQGIGFAVVREAARFAPPFVDLSTCEFAPWLEGAQPIAFIGTARRFQMRERSAALLMGLHAALSSFDPGGLSAEDDVGSGTLRFWIDNHSDLDLVGKVTSPLRSVGFYARSAELTEAIDRSLAGAELIYSKLGRVHAPLFFTEQVEQVFRISPNAQTPHESLEVVAGCLTEVLS